tara:strand:- start:342 stop:521 length:180 start_codon:yes stop_codon:yes gene_type:complete
MANMTKAQARKRLIEAEKKIKAVYFGFNWYNVAGISVAQRNKDLTSIQSIIEKLYKSLK